MSKTAFIFSGQGAQYSGMGKDIYENFPEAKKVYDGAKQSLDRDIAALSFDGDAQELSKTINAQPAIYTLSMAIFSVLSCAGIQPKAVAGFSLGECSALTAAEVVTLEDGFQIIKHRAQAMQKAAEQSGGTMLAVLGLDADLTAKACASLGGFAVPVNYNCPGQIVVSCDAELAQAATDALKGAGAMRVMQLPVGGAFHSEKMEPAAKELQSMIGNIPFRAATVPFYANVDGLARIKMNSLSDYLAKQMVSPVRWQQAVENMLADGMDTFVEIGPGKTLSGFVRKISKDAVIYQSDSLDALHKIIAELK